MREIKFRAWEPGTDGGAGWMMDSVEASDHDISDINEGPYIWMQYTGLKDKNGKEIYDGDVVRFNGNYSDIGKCGWQTEEVRWHDEYPKVIFGTLENYWDVLDEMDSDSIEIIGNIHENPDLINNPTNTN